MTGNNPARRFTVIHGHFYQPPRENPWLNVLERQESAAPDHDWNERIFDQCYRPNAYSRLLDSHGMITGISNNYRHLSFNFGPTLFRWLEQKHPQVAQRIIDADRESCTRFNGHGNAVAQVYNHIIMPLAPRRDKITQIRWGKDFFKARFGRDPEGMWLAETAINMETVDCLIEEGIKYVILAPSQAELVKPISHHEWHKVEHSGIDLKRPYRIYPKTPDGKALNGFLDVFFFDKNLSTAISFENLLTDSSILGNRIQSCFDANSNTDQLVNIATDGETFGHHKPFGDMCLAFFFEHTAKALNLTIANYGYVLEQMPPQHEITLRNAFGEGTAWSCAHGTGRWSRDCGCNTGGKEGWNQTWRAPFRTALDTMRTALDARYEKIMAPLFTDPWAVRHNYCRAMDLTDRAAIATWLRTAGEKSESLKTLSADQINTALQLLAAQKFMLFAYTSCAWFFNDITGIETAQNIMYAFRALELGIAKTDQDTLREKVVKQLEEARSNIKGQTGKTVYEQAVLPHHNYLEVIAFGTLLDKIVLLQAAHTFTVFEFTVTIKNLKSRKKGHTIYHASSVELSHAQMGETAHFSLLLIRSHTPPINGMIAPLTQSFPRNFDHTDPAHWERLRGVQTLSEANLFSESRETLSALYLERIGELTRDKYKTWMHENRSTLDALAGLKITPPAYVTAPISFVLSGLWNHEIRRLETSGKEDSVVSALLDIWKQSEYFKAPLALTESAPLLEQYIVQELHKLNTDKCTDHCDRLRYLLGVVDRFGLPFPKYRIEDQFNEFMHTVLRPLYDEAHKAARLTAAHKEQLLQLVSLARRMNFNTDEFKLKK